MISLIYAQDQQGGIGKDNQMAWHLPEELEHFKESTMGYPIIMGRKTYEAMGRRILPGRQTVILTRDLDYAGHSDQAQVVYDLDQIIQWGQKQDLMVIGGAEIIKQVMPHADRIIRTIIDQTYACDTFVDPVNPVHFQLVKIDNFRESDPSYQIQYWERRS